MITALFVQSGGTYFGLDGVDPWDEARDARLYDGPHSVVAHPPCKRWCRLAKQVQTIHGHAVGDDGGCFESALRSVREFGGVLEHPAHSLAWSEFRLNRPPSCGSWVVADFHGGWTCTVDQGDYGHRASKPTWLYVFGCDPEPFRLIEKTRTMKIVPTNSRTGQVAMMSHKQRSATPEYFRDILIQIARNCGRRMNHEQTTAATGPILRA